MNYEIKNLIKNFKIPKIPYYNKTKTLYTSSAKIYMPKGRKGFLWFTTFKNTPVCIVIELNKNKISKYDIYYCAFDALLSIKTGTIIYGKVIKDKFENKTEFVLERVVRFMGFDKIIVNLKENYNKIKEMLDNYIYTTKVELSLKLSIPVMNYSKTPVLECSNYPFSIYEILDLNGNSFHFNDICCIFYIKPTDKPDVYELYTENKNKNLIFYDIALINDFKTSDMLSNKLHNLPSYNNLDRERYNKEGIEGCYINCVYIKKLKKWKPYEITKWSNRTDPIYRIKQLENSNILI